jgi:hypothetical protein
MWPIDVEKEALIMRLAMWLSSLTLVVITGCVSIYAGMHLTEEERGQYRADTHLMTHRQLRTYLTLPTASERAAYARQVGAAQQLEALPKPERAAVLNGHPFKGMSAEALRLLWGDPDWEKGPKQDAYWYYYGDYFSLAEPGSYFPPKNTIMEVALMDGKVTWWQERLPSSERERFPLQHFLHGPID